MNEAYWAKYPDAPFATLIRVAATYCHPEAYDDAYDDLIARARDSEPDDDEIHSFKEELRRALANPGQLPGNELYYWAQYSDGNDEKFLRRLWHDLYGNESVTGT